MLDYSCLQISPRHDYSAFFFFFLTNAKLAISTEYSYFSPVSFSMDTVQKKMLYLLPSVKPHKNPLMTRPYLQWLFHRHNAALSIVQWARLSLPFNVFSILCQKKKKKVRRKRTRTRSEKKKEEREGVEGVDRGKWKAKFRQPSAMYILTFPSTITMAEMQGLKRRS